MKKLINKALVLAVLTAIFLTATAAASEIGAGVVTGDSLRLRSGPSTDSSTIDYLYKGSEVRVLEQLDGWYKVSWKDKTGYLSASYLDFTPAPAPRDLTGKTGVLIGSSVNFRSGPSTSDDIQGSLDVGDEVALLTLENGWVKAVWNDQEGYICADYVTMDGIPLADPRGEVTGDCVNVRSGPSTDDSILAKVYSGEVVELVSLDNGWYAVQYNGVSGYISADYIRLFTGRKSTRASTVGQMAADKAAEYLGYSYVYGGSSPKSGFDCSGFTMYIYGLLGYDLPHSATSQWYNTGSYVDRSDLQPGDLVLFGDPSRSGGKACSHVGIYIGDDQFIHASNSTSGVITSSLNENYYASYYKGAKRVG